jgi:hypothetical protein
MKKLLFLNRFRAISAAGTLLIFLSFNLRAQEEQRNVSGFNSIGFALPCQLEITQGTTEGLTLKGDKEDMDKIVTEVRGSELKIYTNSHNARFHDVVIRVSVVNLEELSAAGSGNVVFKTGLKTSDFEISLSGSGNLNCDNLMASSTNVNLAGSGSVSLGGVVSEDSEMNIAGSGNINAEKLQVKKCEVSISGSGSARVWATDKLESNIFGSGNVYYKGKPLVDANTAGSGSTKAM